MALTEETIQDKIEIVGDYKILSVRTATVIKKDGAEITRSFHRHSVAPDADISNESAEVQAICNAVHTDAIKTAYAKHLESQEV
jgi:phage host-nuclease inhibitor protein Gam